MATIVSPMTPGESPKRAPRFDDARMTKWPATSKASKPPTKERAALI